MLYWRATAESSQVYLEMAPVLWKEFLELPPWGSRAATLCSSEDVSSQIDGTLVGKSDSPACLSHYESPCFVSLNETSEKNIVNMRKFSLPAENALCSLDFLLQAGLHWQIVGRPISLCQLARHLLIWQCGQTLILKTHLQPFNPYCGVLDTLSCFSYTVAGEKSVYGACHR